MISYKNALSVLEEVALTRPIGTETVSMNDAIGRILAAGVLSREEVPSFNNSAMDGFAVYSGQTQTASAERPIEIPVDGLIAAGDLQAYEKGCATPRATAIEIMTGAPFPTGGHDAVIRIEDVIVERGSDGQARSIRVAKPLKASDNVRSKGTDYAIGQPVLAAGTRLGPEHILACASLGIAQLEVRRRPKVAIVSTGSELVPPDATTLAPGMIRNSTGPFLLAALQRLGVDARYLGIVTDDPALYRHTLERAVADGADLVISTGAVSMGKFDFVPTVLGELGVVTRFHKAAIRPGKPVLFADMDRLKRGTVLFGAPGNPISTAVGLRFFIEPYLRAALGLPRELPMQARLAGGSRKPDGLRCFFKGHARLTSSGLEVESLKGQASYVVSALVEANCWVVLPEEASEIANDAPVDIYPLHNAFERGVIA